MRHLRKGLRIYYLRGDHDLYRWDDSKTQVQMTRSANTVVYYEELCGTYDIEKMLGMQSTSGAVYKEFGNGNWTRVKRLPQ